MRTRSLRTRLVATTLLLLAIASVVVGVATALLVRHSLVVRLDAELATTSRAFVNGSGQRAPEQRFGSDQRGSPGNVPPPVDVLAAQVVDGQVIRAAAFTRAGVPVPVPASSYPTLGSVQPGDPPRSVDLGVLGSYRVIAGTRLDGTVLVTGLPEGQLDQTVTNLVTTEVVVAAGTLLLAAVIGAVVVRRELRPLERVATTARRVSTLPLDRGEVELAERVPDVDPATEVGQVGAALNRMLDHVGAALEARQTSETQLRQFIADASHELRTPLAAIRGYAELTRRGDLPPEAAYSLGRISSQADRMTALVEDLLLLARLDAGRPLERAEVDLTRLVLDAVNDARAAGPRHRWQLDLPEDPVTIPGDASRLAQVLGNLLANARTHTPPGTTVTVTLSGGAREALLSVVDGGPGIPPALLPHVFERFARGSSSRSRHNGSTGLGLSIVDAVVAAHGGRVEVASRPGRTEFAVHLPLVAPARPATATVRPG